MSGDHSLFAPSNADVWVPCPGSIAMALQSPAKPDTLQSKEGQDAHAVAARTVIQMLPAHPGVPPDLITEMGRHAAGWARELKGLGPFKQWKTECTVKADSIHPQCYGTTDFWALTDDGTLIVADYKYGWGIVEPVKNWQLLCYAIGVIDTWIAVGWIKQIKLCIYQPRPYHPTGRFRCWKFPVDQLGRYRDLLHTAARKAEHSGELNAGAHCKYCPAKYGCEELQASALAVVDVSAQPYVANPSDTELANEYRALRYASEILNYRLLALEETIATRIKSGAAVPGYTAAHGRGTYDWDAPVEIILQAGKAEGIDLGKPGLITPTQAKQYGISDVLLEKYAVRKPGKTKIVEQSLDLAKQIFGEKNE